MLFWPIFGAFWCPKNPKNPKNPKKKSKNPKKNLQKNPPKNTKIVKNGQKI